MPEPKCSQCGRILLSDESITSDGANGPVDLGCHTRHDVTNEPRSLLGLLARLERLP
jgi:hypothetical protein